MKLEPSLEEAWQWIWKYLDKVSKHTADASYDWMLDITYNFMCLGWYLKTENGAVNKSLSEELGQMEMGGIWKGKGDLVDIVFAHPSAYSYSKSQI